MHLSRYLKIYSCPDRPGNLLLYSTRRGATILLPESILRAAEEGRLAPADQETLVRLGFLVPDPAAEQEELRGLLDGANRHRKIFNAIVVMNLDCNLACTYCYEGQRKEKRYLSDETAELLVTFIEERAISQGKEVILTFHGGEPLLSRELIGEISGRLKAAAEAKGVAFGFNMITNGTLLTRKVVEELVPLGLKGAKVTLDGPKDIHDRFRPFVSGKGSFDLIVSNVKEVCELIKLQIGGNFSRDNYREFPRLLDFLLEEGITPDKIHRLQFVPITGTAGDAMHPDFNDGCLSVNEPWLIEATIFLREEIMRRGFSTPPIVMSACMVEFADDLVVNHDGALFKCPAFINWQGLSIGDLRSGITDYRASHDLDAWKTDECLECAYLPLCFGGCKFMQLVRDGKIGGLDCKKPYLDATLEALVRQDVQYRK